MEALPVFCGKDCGGNACPLLAEVESGRVVGIGRNPIADPYIRPCRRGFGLAAAHYAPERLRKPLIRVGERGRGEFREASWDEALGLVASRLGELRSRHGPTSTLSLSSAGSTGALHDTGVLTRRFLNSVGGCTSLSGSYSNGAARFVLPYLLGPQWKESGFDAATMRHSKLIVLWGANILETRLGSEMPARLIEARERGAEIVAIDPRRTETVRRVATRWLPCRPGTDAALMLAVLHVLSAEGLADRPFVAAHASGFDALERYVLGLDGATARTPEWAAGICGLPSSDIRDFARSYAAAKPAMLVLGYSIQRVDGGEESFRLAVALQLATGNFGRRGGSTGSLNNRLPQPRVGRLGDVEGGSSVSVPVLRWPDAILEGTRGGYPGEISSAYCAGGNFLNQGAEIAKGIAALESLDFSVCHDMFLTPTARYCDVVLPAASPLEKEDIGIPWHGNYLLYKRTAVAPEGLARSDYDVFCELAERMGGGREFSLGRSASQWIDSFIADSEIGESEAFKASGVYLGRDRDRVGLAAFAADPGGQPLGTPSGLVEISSEAYERDTGLPAIPTWRGAAADPRYPLSLVTPKLGDRTHSQGGDAGGHARLAQDVTINPWDAARRGIGQGDLVLVSNARGSLVAPARLSDDIARGVVCVPEGRWFELDERGRDRAGSPNVLTSTKGTEPSLSCVMHAIAVDVGRFP